MAFQRIVFTWLKPFHLHSSLKQQILHLLSTLYLLESGFGLSKPLTPTISLWLQRLSNFWFLLLAYLYLFGQVCLPSSPETPDLIYPSNGVYVDQSSFNMTFYGSGSFGVICSPFIDQAYYEVFLFNA